MLLRKQATMQWMGLITDICVHSRDALAAGQLASEYPCSLIIMQATTGVCSWTPSHIWLRQRHTSLVLFIQRLRAAAKCELCASWRFMIQAFSVCPMLNVGNFLAWNHETTNFGIFFGNPRI